MEESLDHYLSEIGYENGKLQKWIDFMFLNDAAAKSVRDYFLQNELSEIEMYKLICTILFRQKYELSDINSQMSRKERCGLIDREIKKLRTMSSKQRSVHGAYINFLGKQNKEVENG